MATQPNRFTLTPFLMAKDHTPDPKTAAPTVKVEVTTPDTPKTPQQEIEDGAAARKAADDAKGAENQALIDAGKVVAPGPIYGYEHQLAKLGTPSEDDPTEPAKGEDK